MVKVFNNTNSKITTNTPYAIEIGHNQFTESVWATLFHSPDIKALIENNSLLVGNYEDYRAFENAVDILWSFVETNNAINGIKAIGDKAQKKQQAQDELKRIQGAQVILEIYSDDFKNDVKTAKKIKIINATISDVIKELETLAK